jgi:hypothetical protein
MLYSASVIIFGSVPVFFGLEDFAMDEVACSRAVRLLKLSPPSLSPSLPSPSAGARAPGLAIIKLARSVRLSKIEAGPTHDELAGCKGSARRGMEGGT